MLKSRTITLSGKRVARLKFGKNSVLRGLELQEWEMTQFLADLDCPAIPERKRVLSILEEMLFLARAGQSTIDQTERGPLTMEIENRKAMLNSELARYRFTPYVFMEPGSSELAVIWHRDWRDEIEPMKPPDRLLEGQSIELILNLARSGHLLRLRKCLTCEKWLFARFIHQQFCSTKCQQKHNSQKEDFKVRRAEYQRAYYKEHHAKLK
jgi:hypothetical protein